MMNEKLNVLLVEDSEDDALLNIIHIKKGGYTIEFERVETAVDLKNALKNQNWDIILSDYKMPNFNGLEALSIVKDCATDIPFIIISGTIGEELAVEAMKAGAHDYIMKDKLQRLLPAVEREIREAKNRAKQRRLIHKEKLLLEERLSHFKYFECMDKVNRAIQGANDFEKTMSDVLDVVISIFNCDRAYLQYPCDPNSKTWTIPIEKYKPEYPGVLEKGTYLPVDDDVVKSFQILLNTDGPVMFGPGTMYPLPSEVSKQFKFKSYMAMAIYPKIGKPWQFGIHQCSDIKIWSKDDNKLLHEIGSRLTDGLTSLLMYREKEKGEAENRAIVNAVPDLLFRVNKDGIILDFRKPDIIDFYLRPDQLLGKSLSTVIPTSVIDTAKKSIMKALATNEVVTFEYDFALNETRNYFEGRAIKFASNEALIVIRDITEKKQAELRLDVSEKRYKRITEGLTDYLYSVKLIDGFPVETKQGSACETVTGYNAKEFEKDPYLWYRMILDEDRMMMKEHVRKILSGIDVKPIEHRIICKDGTVKWVIDTTILNTDINGKLISYDGVIKDITERKNSEEALRLSEERFSKIFQLSPIATIIFRTSDNVIINVNDVFLRDTGYNRDEIIGHTTLDLNLYANAEDRVKSLKILGEKEIVENYEFRIKTKSGAIRFCLHTTININLGGELHYLSLIQDITERKEAEDELRKLSQAVEQSPVTVLITNIKGLIEYVNPKFTEITGYSKEEAVGQNPRVLKSGDMAAENYAQLWQAISTGKEWFGEFHNKKKNGELYWEMASISPIFNHNGEITHYLAVKEDITERKMAEEALLNSERKYRIVADNTYSWEFWANTEGYYIYCSPSCYRVTGYTAKEFTDNHGLRTNIVHPDYKTEFSHHLSYVNTNQGGGCIQYKIIHKNGTERWIEHICQPVFDQDGSYLGERGTNRDITEDKETERRILNAIITTEEIERNKFSQELHDGLGPMLSTVKLYFEWLAETMEADKREGIIETGIENINEAIQAVRNISNKLSPRVLNKLGLIPAIKYSTQKIDNTQKIKIVFTYDTEIRYKSQIEVTLYRVLSELINNTIKHAQAKEILIKIKHDSNKERIFVVYEDNGIGFNITEAMKIGKGLGIQNIIQRIETFDGKISFDTKKGKSLSVKIELPLNQLI